LVIDWNFAQNKKTMFHRIAQNKAVKILDLILFHAPECGEFISCVTEEMTHGDKYSSPLYLALPSVDIVRRLMPYYIESKTKIDWEYISRTSPEVAAELDPKNV
jgi:hypothetical protein